MKRACSDAKMTGKSLPVMFKSILKYLYLLLITVIVAKCQIVLVFVSDIPGLIKT